MTDQDEAQRFRIRDSAFAEEVKRLESDFTCGTTSLVARTKVLNSYPSTAQSFFACESLTVLGGELEGKPGVVSPNPTTFFALNLGTTLPPVGSQLLVTLAGNRWVFRYDA